MLRRTLTRSPLLMALCALPLFTACAADGGSSGDGPPVEGACDCAEAVCGMNPCGESCGTCNTEGMGLCWDGQCADHALVEDVELPVAECKHMNFIPMAEAGYTRLSGGKLRLFFVATQGGQEPPFQKITIELNHDALEGDGVGIHEIKGEGQPGCDMCVRAYSYCNYDGCAQVYLAESGTLEIESAGRPGTPLRGRLKNVIFKQVLDQGGEYKEYAKGYNWCFGDYEFNFEVPELNEAEGFCVDDGTGMLVGDNIGDYTLTNCLEQEVNLHSRCGLTNAVWLVVTAGWCGACKKFVPKVGDYFRDTPADKGLDIMILYGETPAAVKPTIADCYQYAEEMGIDPAQVFIDNTDGRAWGNTFDRIENYAGGSLGIPWSCLLDGRSMEYIWSSTVGTGTIYEEMEALLDRSWE